MSFRRGGWYDYPYSDAHVDDSGSNTVREVLDLHGYSKEKAIRATTIFFTTIRSKHQQSFMTPGYKYMVEIITGIGHHSTHGPVLRSAVATLLLQRQMDHKLSPSQGSFIVDALSGIDLYEDTASRYDSKVVVVDQHDSLPLNKSLQTTTTTHYRTLVTLSDYIKSNHSHPKHDEDEDTLIESIKEMSSHLAQKEDVMLQTKEEQEMKRAILKSLEWRRIYELDNNDDRTETQRALELSRIETEVAEYEYSKILENVIKSSIYSEQDYLSVIEQEQRELELAMESSRNDYEAPQSEEDDQIRLALQLS